MLADARNRVHLEQVRQSLSLVSIEPWLWALLAFLVRWPFAAAYPGGFDDVDFALGIQWYDISMMQPHFPGYPVYIAIAKVIRPLFDNPFATLSFISVVAGALTIIPLMKIVEKLRAARVTVLLWMLSPLPFVSSIQPTSEALALLFAMLGIASSLRLVQEKQNPIWSWVAPGIWFALMLGVRISYVPLLSVWIWALWKNRGQRSQRRRILDSVIAFGAVNFSWLLALLVSAGAVGSQGVNWSGLMSFWKLATGFTAGHFEDWGGTYHEGASVVSRLSYWIGRQWLAAGVGTIWEGAYGWRWVVTLVVSLAVVGWLLLWKNRRWHVQSLQFWLVWVIPYSAWAFFAQNVEKPRHILPLVPVLLVALQYGIYEVMQQKERLWLAVMEVWVAAAACVTLPIAWEARQYESPMAQLAQYVGSHYQTQDTVIFTYEESRVIQVDAPKVTAITLRKWIDLKTALLQNPVLPSHILMTNAVYDGLPSSIKRQLSQVEALKQVAVFQGSPWLYPTYHTIVLFEGRTGLSKLIQGRGN